MRSRGGRDALVRGQVANRKSEQQDAVLLPIVHASYRLPDVQRAAHCERCPIPKRYFSIPRRRSYDIRVNPGECRNPIAVGLDIRHDEPGAGVSGTQLPAFMAGVEKIRTRPEHHAGDAIVLAGELFCNTARNVEKREVARCIAPHDPAFIFRNCGTGDLRIVDFGLPQQLCVLRKDQQDAIR